MSKGSMVISRSSVRLAGPSAQLTCFLGAGTNQLTGADLGMGRAIHFQYQAMIRFARILMTPLIFFKRVCPTGASPESNDQLCDPDRHNVAVVHRHGGGIFPEVR